MVLTKWTTTISSLIILTVTSSSVAFEQVPLKGTAEGRALELRELLESIEGQPKEPPRAFRTNEGYLRFVMAPKPTSIAS